MTKHFFISTGLDAAGRLSGTKRSLLADSLLFEPAGVEAAGLNPQIAIGAAQGARSSHL